MSWCRLLELCVKHLHSGKLWRMLRSARLSDRYSAMLTLYCHSNTVMQLAHCACTRIPGRHLVLLVLLSSLLLIILSFTNLWIVFTSDGKEIQHGAVDFYLNFGKPSPALWEITGISYGNKSRPDAHSNQMGHTLPITVSGTHGHRA